jgi:hypothetical protein
VEKDIKFISHMMAGEELLTIATSAFLVYINCNMMGFTVAFSYMNIMYFLIILYPIPLFFYKYNSGDIFPVG